MPCTFSDSTIGNGDCPVTHQALDALPIRGRPKVRELGRPVLVQQHVVALDVPVEAPGRVHRRDTAREPLTDPGGPDEVGRAREHAPVDEDAAAGVCQLEKEGGLPVGDGVALEGQAEVAAHGVQRARLQQGRKIPQHVDENN